MTKVLRYTVDNIGRMLDIAPRGKGPAAKRLQGTTMQIFQRNDQAMIRRDFIVVGNDMKKAMQKIQHG